MGVQKAVLIYTREQGTEVEKQLENVMRAANFTNYMRMPISTMNVKFTEEMKKIDQENPDLFVFFTFPTPTMNFMRQMKEKIHNKVIISDASIVSDFFADFIRKKVKRYIIGSSVPDPKQVKLDVPIKEEKEPLKLFIIQNYKKASEKRGVSIDSAGLIAYISGKILVEILRKVEGVITKEKIIAVAESMKDVDLAGLPISFDPLRHEFAKYVFLETNSENWFALDASKFPYLGEFESPEDIEIKRKIESRQKSRCSLLNLPSKNNKLQKEGEDYSLVLH
jgi:ABC-type branched-subunit amino acid transport system substrate-binding protein